MVHAAYAHQSMNCSIVNGHSSVKPQVRAFSLFYQLDQQMKDSRKQLWEFSSVY